MGADRLEGRCWFLWANQESRVSAAKGRGSGWGIFPRVFSLLIFWGVYPRSFWGILPRVFTLVFL